MISKLIGVVAILGLGTKVVDGRVDISVAGCDGLDSIPNPLQDDTYVDFKGDVTCSPLKTVPIVGDHLCQLNSDTSVTFSGVRFEILEDSKLDVKFAAGQDAVFQGNEAEADGGVFFVGEDSELVFRRPAFFRDNTVAATESTTYTGGAIYSIGKVTFEDTADFTGNSAVSNFDTRAGCGGAIYTKDKIEFEGKTTFEGNNAGAGGAGGALCNLDEAVFRREAVFIKNVAREDGDEVGGEGGAVYAGIESKTVFKYPTTFTENLGDNSAGAIYSAGRTTLESDVFFHYNKAKGADFRKGGQVFVSRGDFKVKGATDFTGGSANDGGGMFIDTKGEARFVGDVLFASNQATDGSGGAVFVNGEGELTFDNGVSFLENTATDSCPNIFKSGDGTVKGVEDFCGFVEQEL